MAMMVGASLCFSGMGVCFRLAMQEGLPIAFVPFARSVFTLALMAPWLLRQGVAGMVTRRPWVMVARCAAGLVTFQSWMYALLLLPLADAVSIAQSRPLWAIPLAALFLSERVRGDRVLAALVGFCGVVIIAQPSGECSVRGVGRPQHRIAAAAVRVPQEYVHVRRHARAAHIDAADAVHAHACSLAAHVL